MWRGVVRLLGYLVCGVLVDAVERASKRGFVMGHTFVESDFGGY